MPTRQESVARRSGPLSAPSDPRLPASKRPHEPRQSDTGASSSFDPIAALPFVQGPPTVCGQPHEDRSPESKRRKEVARSGQ
eukprot:11044171-Heterocapsa_arctica.AAC.1